MDSQPPSLRRGEILAGVSAAALLIVLFALDWLRASGAGRTGWSAVPVLRWFVLAAALSALVLAGTQATMRGPALPVAMSVVATILSALTTLLLVIRLITTGATPQVGGYLGLVALIAMTCGCFASLRVEQGWSPGPDRPIETVALRTPHP
jgi:hypothetical protein